MKPSWQGVLLGVGLALAAWLLLHGWQDHANLHGLVQLEVERQAAAKTPAVAPVTPAP